MTIIDAYGHEWTRDTDGLGEQRDSPKGQRWMTYHGRSYPTRVNLALVRADGIVVRHFECDDYDTAHRLADVLDHVS